MTLSGAVSAHGIVLTIEDNGIGIDPGDIARVCEPFWQAEPVLSRRYGGTGLGCRWSRLWSICTMRSLKIDSVIGEGTRVTVEFPMVTADSRERSCDGNVIIN